VDAHRRQRARRAVREEARGWYETKAITSDKKAFRYLWNCNTEPYDSPDYADLNILIGHVFGAAYALTKDKPGSISATRWR